MRIGTVHLEEARALDAMAGDHTRGIFHFEVYWCSGSKYMSAGWWWQGTNATGLPTGSNVGPFASSRGAYYDALESVGVEI